MVILLEMTLAKDDRVLLGRILPTGGLLRDDEAERVVAVAALCLR